MANKINKITKNGVAYDIEDPNAATATQLEAEKTARQNADGDLQNAINGKQATLTTDQLAAVNSGIDSTKVGQIATNTESITTINGKIPAQATSSNQLADKDFVNSSIATNTANFIGTFNSVAELEAYSGAVTNNDYAFVIVTDAQGNTAYDRYKYNGSTSTWLFEYELNNSSFTADQWASINSGITSGDVSKLAGIAAGAEVNVQSNWNESDTSSDAYIQNKPTIPTVNDATLTITQNGTSVGTFTANASTDATIALTDTTYSAFTGATASTAGTAGLVPAPAAGDESKVLKGDGTWTGLPDGIKTLTTADYNYPTTGTATGIAAWNLEKGVYRAGSSNLMLYYAPSTGTAYRVELPSNTIFVISYAQGGGTTLIYPRIGSGAAGSDGGRTWNFASLASSTLNAGDAGFLLSNKNIIDNLTSTSVNDTLSAAQGKVLNENKADKTAFTGTDGTSAGTMGLVPAPATTDAGKFLKADGSWGEAGGGSTNNIFQVTSYYDDSTSSWKIRESVTDIEAAINSQTPIALVIEKYQDNGRDEIDFVYKSFVLTSEIALFGARVASPNSDTSSSGAGTLGLYSRVLRINRTTGAAMLNNYENLIPGVAQTTGTSTTDVMSQNAVTSMVFADPSTRNTVAIGNNAQGSVSAVAIGASANASSSEVAIGSNAAIEAVDNTYGSVAVGRFAKAGGESAVAVGAGAKARAKGAVALARSEATTKGEFAIGFSGQDYQTLGYNNSNYRLLTGLYDPQSAHDAATKGYVDGTTETLTIADTDWSALSSSDPYTYSATVSVTATIGANSTVELINDNAVSFGTYGFAIGSVDQPNNTVTVYSIGSPSASVNLKINVKGA